MAVRSGRAAGAARPTSVRSVRVVRGTGNEPSVIPMHGDAVARAAGFCGHDVQLGVDDVIGSGHAR